MSGYGAIDQKTLISISGLEALRGIISGDLPTPPIARTMNIRMTAVETGEAVFEGAPTGDHLNPMGAIQGGWAGAILDAALGCAVMTVLPAGRYYTTLEYKVNLCRALMPGTATRAAATVAHAGRSTAVATAELRGTENGRLYATGSTTCAIFDWTG